MNNKKQYTLAAASLILLSNIITYEAKASCDKVGDVITYDIGGTPVRDSGIPTDSCSDIPDAYQITFFKIAVCKKDPSAGAVIGGFPNFDLAGCSFIYGKGADIPLTHEITVPASAALATGPFSLKPDDYSFMAMTFSNKLGMKNTATFSEDVRGFGGTTGTTCFTSGGLTTFHNESVTTGHGVSLPGGVKTITCGAKSDAAPVFNFEVITHLGGKNDSCTDFTPGDAGEFDNGSISGAAPGGRGAFTARVLKTDGTYADGCANSTQILWVISFADRKSITPTSTYRLDFKLTDAVSIDFDSSDKGSIQKMGNDPPQAIFTVF